jgi:hypothetical protein
VKKKELVRNRYFRNTLFAFVFSVDVDQTLAEKELEARRKILEERRLREEARLSAKSE